MNGTSDSSQLDPRSLLDRASQGTALRHLVEEEQDPVTQALDSFCHSGKCRKQARDEKCIINCPVCLAEDHYDVLRMDLECLEETLSEEMNDLRLKALRTEQTLERLQMEAEAREKQLGKIKAAIGVVGLLVLAIAFDCTGPSMYEY